MKKNLRNVLVLALGLTTTIASAQWSADSRTRIDNSNDDNRSAEQRITVGADWGGIHASADLNYDVDGGEATHSIYEAYASTNFMGLDMTMGRRDLSYGSGYLMSSNDWGMNRYTNDGIEISTSVSGFSINAGTLDGVDMDNNYMNLSGGFGDATVNILMMNSGDNSAHGYDLGYTLMGGALTINASMNSDYDEDEMTSYGLSYSGFGGFTLSASQTTYDGAFDMANTAMSGGWANGSIGYLNAGDQDMTIGISGSFSGVTLGYEMHTISNDAAAEDREANKLSLGYSLNDNASLGIDRFQDGDDEWTYITISVGL